MKQKFTILSDPGAKVISRFGLLHAAGHGSEDIAIRTSVFLDEKGVEQWRRVSSSATDTPSVEEIMQKVNQK